MWQPCKSFPLKALQNTRRLIDDCKRTNILSRVVFHIFYWLRSFVGGQITISLNRNVHYKLFLITFHRIMKFYVEGQILCLFHFIVFASWAQRCINALMNLTQQPWTTYLQWNPMIIIFVTQAHVSNQNSTPLNSVSNHSGILLQNCGMSCLLTLDNFESFDMFF